MRWTGVISCLIALMSLVYDVSAQDSLSVGRTKAQGFDAGRMVEAGRERAPHRTTFHNHALKDNLSISAVALSQTPRGEDFGFLNSAGLTVSKWVTPSVGARIAMTGGYMYSNLNGLRVPEMSVQASLMFNVSSYVGGYDVTRFCELSAVFGAGYACEWDSVTRHFFTGNVGVNVNMRVAPRVSLMVEPSIPLRVGREEFTYGFATMLGLSCDMSTHKYDASCAGRWFVCASGGLQVQNSALVKQAGPGGALGFSASAGVGRRFDDFFAMRMSAAYSRHVWAVYYGVYMMPADYYALRLEGVLDVVRLALRKSYNGCFGAGVVLGPELGYMVKKDVGYSLKRQYVGLNIGLQGNCRLGKSVNLFVEPRFCLVPYTAQNDDSTSYNFNRNYYDSLFNLNLGLEIAL